MLQDLRIKLYRYICQVFVCLFAVMLTGCEKEPVSGGLGSVAGMAQLSPPDGSTGHAGVLVFLAGTSFQARTDTKGRYRIDGIPAGTYDLVAEKPGFQGQVSSGLVVNPAVNSQDFPLQPATAVLTQIEVAAEPTTATAARAVITGEVFLQGVSDNENGGIRIEVNDTAYVTVSNNRGQYRILDVEPGNYTLSFYKDGYRPITSEAVEVTSGTTALETEVLEVAQEGDPVSPASAAAAAAIKVVVPDVDKASPVLPDEPRSIVGVVDLRDPEGQPVQNFEDVTIGINGTNLAATVNEQGQFRFDNLTSGVYTLIGVYGDAALNQLAVDLVNDRSASVIMKIGEGATTATATGTIQGRVVLLDMEGQPAEDASGVQLTVSGTQAMATSAADGSFTLTGVNAGSYTINAAKETYDGAKRDSVIVNGGETADVGELQLNLKVDRPRVVSTDPGRDAGDVPVSLDLPIMVKFSAKMNPESVQRAVSISPNTPFTALIGKGAGVGTDDDTLVIRLSNEDYNSPIQFGANYRVVINESAANLDGVTMADSYSFNFRTANPGVIRTSPENGAQGVYVDQINAPVLITFNTRLDPKTVNDRNIRVKPDNGISVSTTYTDADDTGWTTVRLGTQWQPNTNYTITVSRRVKAKNGQSLGNTPYTLRFRTQALEVMSMPIITTR